MAKLQPEHMIALVKRQILNAVLPRPKTQPWKLELDFDVQCPLVF